MAELADAIDLGSISKEWGFESLYPHQQKSGLTFVNFDFCLYVLNKGLERAGIGNLNVDCNLYWLPTKD